MEVYLNVIETGQGLYGAEAAARKYYRKPAAKLSRQQAAMIAAILPNPRQRDPVHPTSYLNGRQQKILRNMRNIQEVRFY
ncbi:MAG: transglycosylase domain-containing protein, partial [Bacteroidales bacterium]|nr:transglycosylase domain-containing protein [Bacteroidales bacterium]